MLKLGEVYYNERTLIENAMRNMRRNSAAHPQRWIAVKEMFCVGSTVANALCIEFGYDPDEKLKR